MQLMPPPPSVTACRADKTDAGRRKADRPETNIRAGSRYLRDLIDMFPGQLELALAAYNAGEGAVQRAGNRIPNYPETQNYVKTVMQLYTVLKPPHRDRSLSCQAPGSGAARARKRAAPHARLTAAACRGRPALPPAYGPGRSSHGAE